METRKANYSNQVKDFSREKAEIECYINVGRQEFKKGNYKMAKCIWEQSLEKCRTFDYRAARFVLLKNIGDISVKMDSGKEGWNERIRYYQMALDEAIACGVHQHPYLQSHLQILIHALTNPCKKENELNETSSGNVQCATCGQSDVRTIQDVDCQFYCIQCYEEYYNSSVNTTSDFPVNNATTPIKNEFELIPPLQDHFGEKRIYSIHQLLDIRHNVPSKEQMDRVNAISESSILRHPRNKIET